MTLDGLEVDVEIQSAPEWVRFVMHVFDSRDDTAGTRVDPEWTKAVALLAEGREPHKAETADCAPRRRWDQLLANQRLIVATKHLGLVSLFCDRTDH